MFHLLKRRFSTCARQSARRKIRRQLRFETLQPRELMAADIVVTWNGGIVHVAGTDSADTIVISQQGDQYVFTGGKFSLPEGNSGLPTRYPIREFRVDGKDGNDVVYNDTLIPMMIHGGRGDDTITGGQSADTLYGEEGDDFIRGRGSSDEIRGGPGNDKLYSDLDDKFDAHAPGSDFLSGGEGHDVLDGSIDIDGMSWNDGVLYIQGTERTDRGDRIVVRQNDGRLYIDGVHRFWPYPDVVEVRGGAGNDTIYNDSSIRMVAYGGDGIDALTGGPGNDVFHSDSDELVRGRDGEDTLIVQGTSGDDRMIFRPVGGDVQVESRGRFWNASGIEFLRAVGGEGNDYLYNDTYLPSELNGGAGRDVLTGGGGNDVFFTDSDQLVRGRGGSDTLIVFGTVGDDKIVVRSRNGEVEVESLGRRWDATGIETIEARGAEGNDSLRNDTVLPSKLFGEVGDDTLVGGAGSDHIDGGDGNDRLLGRGGNDRLLGRGGIDILIGGEGNDGLFGGLGATDHLEGGNGADRFLWRSNDVIVDLAAVDARILFEDDGAAWTNAHIELVDVAFDQLHRETGNTRLLKGSLAHGVGEWLGLKDPYPQELIFKRGANHEDIVGLNSRGKVITLFNPAFVWGSDWTLQTVYHEIGHNWDDEWAFGHGWMDLGQWDDDDGRLRVTTEWRRGGDRDWWFRVGSKFASDYSQQSPYEDFADSFAAYFMFNSGRDWETNFVALGDVPVVTSLHDIQDKAAFVEGLLEHGVHDPSVNGALATASLVQSPTVRPARQIEESSNLLTTADHREKRRIHINPPRVHISSRGNVDAMISGHCFDWAGGAVDGGRGPRTAEQLAFSLAVHTPADATSAIALAAEQLVEIRPAALSRLEPRRLTDQVQLELLDSSGDLLQLDLGIGARHSLSPQNVDELFSRC